jgi:putative peptidoglycan lipid II flippase
MTKQNNEQEDTPTGMNIDSPENVDAEGHTSVEVVVAADDAAMVPTGILEKAPGAVVETVETSSSTERKHLVRSAALVSVGNLGSSLLGMVRQITVVTSLGSGRAGDFNAALTPVNNFYQLLVNGSTDGALVPVFNEYAAIEKRQEMRRVVFTVVNLVLIIALITSCAYFLISPWFMNILVSGYPHQSDRDLALHFSQIIFFSLVFLGPFAVLLAALFALKEFGWPAFATAAYHIGVIVGAIFASLSSSFILALPIGLLIGAAGQILLLLPGIRNRRLYYMFVLDLKHPAIRRILKLYWPIAISYVFSLALVFLDLFLQSHTPQSNNATTAMVLATTLIQFPVGIVAQALSVVVLPTLAEHAREGNNERFKETLMLGFRLGLLLMIPAMVGLLVLRTPIIYLLFAHHNYRTGDATLPAQALQYYSYQLPFLVIDQLLIAAFYARNNTKTPVVIGIVSIIFYLVIALPFYRTIGMVALVSANTVQNSAHAVILLILLRLAIGPLHIRNNLLVFLKIGVSATLMGFAAWGMLLILNNIALFSLSHFIGQLLTLLVAGGIAVVVYFGAIFLFKVEEVRLIRTVILTKLKKA